LTPLLNSYNKILAQNCEVLDMETKKRANVVLTTLKLLIMVALAGVIVAGAFLSGVVFRGWSTPQQAAIAAETTETASSQPVIISSDDAAPGFDVFWEAWGIVEREFYGEVPDVEERVFGAIRGMVFTYGDENTAFIDPTRASLLQEDASGSFEGIGASVQLDEVGRLVIAEPFVGRPAAEAGVQRGDVVLEVDGESLLGLSLYESVALIRGEAGSTVILTIARQGLDEPIEIPVVRAKIEIEVVESRVLDDNIGYVSLSEFSSGSSRKLLTAIEDLQDQGVEKLVLDLRNNPGGLLTESVAVTSLFLNDEIVLREKRKGFDQEQTYQATGINPLPDIPLVVLINRGSASASEIVAGALKDHSRATIIGEQSFGKGTVQLPHTLRDGSELRVTIAEWFTPDGNTIDETGIVPDIVVERTQADFFDNLDPQLDRAIEVLNESN
jgi:carboxyl-terminal processing protease